MGKPGQGAFVPMARWLVRTIPKRVQPLLQSLQRRRLHALPSPKIVYKMICTSYARQRGEEKQEDQLLAGEMVGALSLAHNQSSATAESHSRAMGSTREVDIFV